MAALAADVGYRPDEPLVVGLRRPEDGEVIIVQGGPAPELSLRPDAVVYTASLSKQLTAACVALLVREAKISLDSTLAEWLPELPGWARSVYVRHLLHHIAALPADADLDAACAARGAIDRTTDDVIEALASVPSLVSRPGTQFAYSNAGYICLGVIVERAAGQSLRRFADQHLFGPTGMSHTCFWSGPGPAPPDSIQLTPSRPAPLSLGDGGVWSTVEDLLRWSRCLNENTLGVGDLMQTPGRLDDHTPLDYAWGMGVRALGGHQFYRHGGAWANIRTMLTRAPALGLSLVTIAISDDTEHTVSLTDALLGLLTEGRRAST